MHYSKLFLSLAFKFWFCNSVAMLYTIRYSVVNDLLSTTVQRAHLFMF